MHRIFVVTIALFLFSWSSEQRTLCVMHHFAIECEALLSHDRTLHVHYLNQKYRNSAVIVRSAWADNWSTCSVLSVQVGKWCNTLLAVLVCVLYLTCTCCAWQIDYYFITLTLVNWTYSIVYWLWQFAREGCNIYIFVHRTIWIKLSVVNISSVVTYMHVCLVAVVLCMHSSMSVEQM